MEEFRKVGADVSYFQSQMHSEYESAESFADSDLEDGELRRMPASPLYLQSREDNESSRRPIGTGKPAAFLQEKGASAEHAQADSRKGLDGQVRLRNREHRGNLLHSFHLEMKNQQIISRVLFSETLTRQIWEDLFLKAIMIIC